MDRFWRITARERRVNRAQRAVPSNPDRFRQLYKDRFTLEKSVVDPKRGGTPPNLYMDAEEWLTVISCESSVTRGFW